MFLFNKPDVEIVKREQAPGKSQRCTRNTYDSPAFPFSADQYETKVSNLEKEREIDQAQRDENLEIRGVNFSGVEDQ